MRKRSVASRILLAAPFLLYGLGCQKEKPRLANEGQKGLDAATLGEILALPADQIDFATAALLISRDADPTVDVQSYRNRIDELALSIKSRLKPRQSLEDTSDVMVEELFEKRGYDFSLENTGETHFLSTLLDTRKGDCVAWLALHMSLGERLGIEVKAVQLPAHCFVRLEDDDEIVNLDVWMKRDDDYYLEHYRIPPDHAGGYYLSSLSKSEALGYVLTQYAIYHLRRREYERAFRLATAAKALNGRDPAVWMTIADAFSQTGQYPSAVETAEFAIQLSPHEARLSEFLGIVHLRNHDLARAEEILQHALALDSNRLFTLCALGETCFLKSERAKGIAYYSKALNLKMEKLDPRKHPWIITSPPEAIALALKEAQAKITSGLKLGGS